MSETDTPSSRHQEAVNQRFSSPYWSSYWKDVYTKPTAWGEIWRARQDVVLKWIDELCLPAGARVLDVGCGAGHLSAQLAMRGFSVHAVDSSATMVDLTLQQATASGVTDRVSASVGDANALPFEQGDFDLVVAVGLFSWVEHPIVTVREMARVTRPGGYVLVTVANLFALRFLLDPQMHPWLLPFKLWLKRVLDRTGIRAWAPPYMPYSIRYVEATISGNGLVPKRVETREFEPFTVFARQIFSSSVSAQMQRNLQRLADRQTPLVRSLGSYHYVLAQKPEG